MRIIRHSSDHGRADDTMENDEVLEEMIRYDPKEEDTFVDGALSGNQGQDKVGRNSKGAEICAHSGLGRDNKVEIIALNDEMINLDNRVEKLEKRENGTSAIDGVYFGDNVLRDTRMLWLQ